MGGIIAGFGWLMAKILGDNLLKWVAIKAIITLVVLVILPIIFNNIIYDILNTSFELANENSGEGGGISGAMSFSGLCAYLLASFRIPECISVICSGMLVRQALNMIPFIRG